MNTSERRRWEFACASYQRMLQYAKTRRAFCAFVHRVLDASVWDHPTSKRGGWPDV